ncbi:MAG: hypothetical protein ACREL9_08980 [Gemmatimonadales bacterium]
MRRSLLIALLLTAGPPDRLNAQVVGDTTRVDTSRAVAPAPARRQIGPGGAFWRSLLLPGWGQAATGRHVTGAVFVAWEGVAAMMTLKAQDEAEYLKEAGSTSLRLKRQEVQDWLVLWIFNHLFAGAEAYVSAHLQDFPGELKLRALPNGIELSLPLP